VSGRVIDLGPYLEEATRMLNGEIPFSQGYLNELIPVGVTVNMVCGKCGALLFAYTCPECQLVPRADCQMCAGAGVWFECPSCETG